MSDAQANTHGVLEEVETGANTVQEPAKAGTEPQRRIYDRQQPEGLLGSCKHPHSENRPLQPKVGKGGVSGVLTVLQVCSGINKGGAVYRTVRTVLWEVG